MVSIISRGLRLYIWFGRSKETYLKRLIKFKGLWNTALFVMKVLQVNKVGGITEPYIIAVFGGKTIISDAKFGSM